MSKVEENQVENVDQNEVKDKQGEDDELKSENTSYYKKLTKTEVDKRIDKLVKEAFDSANVDPEGKFVPEKGGPP